jgi:hypothetical protein
MAPLRGCGRLVPRHPRSRCWQSPALPLGTIREGETMSITVAVSGSSATLRGSSDDDGRLVCELSCGLLRYGTMIVDRLPSKTLLPGVISCTAVAKAAMLFSRKRLPADAVLV